MSNIAGSCDHCIKEDEGLLDQHTDLGGLTNTRTGAKKPSVRLKPGATWYIISVFDTNERETIGIGL